MQFKNLALFAGAFALVACGGGEAKPADSAAAPAAEAPAAAPAAEAPAAAAGAAAPITGTTHEVKMIGDEKGYRFEPAEITVKAGDGIKFLNVKGGPHNVAFDEATFPAAAKAQMAANMPNSGGALSGTMMVTDGESYTVSFGNIPAGTYEGVCTPHSAMNMKIKITVQ
ncbi:MAG: plastocyanin/azurin family copper-binding protein [Gemmatimonadaceae bacterium]|jgi:plastocyanin|nr:plastocyanin/azurin family copper-binding protein [Gemmatimonadaceae bacterium]